jgi:hypothetical protein
MDSDQRLPLLRNTTLVLLVVGLLFVLLATMNWPANWGLLLYASVAWGGATYTIFRYFRIKTATSFSTVLISPKGNEYPAVVGDDLAWYKSVQTPAWESPLDGGVRQGLGSFSGVDVALPQPMPHIYLDDNMKHNGKRMQFVIDASQKLGLEGDFDKHFTLYAPKSFAYLALSVMSPDVMQTVMQQSNRFDVELDDNHMRIIAGRRAGARPALQQEMIDVALSLLNEFDARSTWIGELNAKDIAAAKLHIYPFRGVRVYGRYLMYRRIFYIIWALMVTVGLFAAGLTLLFYAHVIEGVIATLFGAALFAAMSLLGFGLDAEARFHSRDGSKSK